MVSYLTNAQEKIWSIQDCMEYAIKNNITVQQQNLLTQDAELNIKDAKGAFLPNLPLTYSAFFVGSLALAGFPFLTGFYSKDLILEICQVYRNNNVFFVGSLACVFGNLAVFFTSFYSFRLLFFTFINKTNTPRIIYNSISESSFFIFLLVPK